MPPLRTFLISCVLALVSAPAQTVDQPLKPKERPRVKESEVIYGPRPVEVHGSVSLTYGRSSGGREYRVGSFAVTYYDPVHRFSFGLAVSRAKGDLFPDYFPGHYSYGFGYPGSDFYRPWLPLGWIDDNGFSHRARCDHREDGRSFRRFSFCDAGQSRCR